MLRNEIERHTLSILMASESTHSTAAETIAEPAGVLGTLGIHLGSFIGQLFNVTLVVLILWWWVYRPLMKKMDERSQKISQGLTSAEEATKQLASAKQDAQQVLREAQLQAEATMKASTAEVEAMRSERLAKTQQEVEALLERSRQEIAEDRSAALASLQAQIADMVMLAAKKIVEPIADQVVHEKAVAKALSDIDHV